MTNASGEFYRGLFLTSKVPSCVVSLTDIRRLFIDLHEKANDALENHIASSQKPVDQSEEGWEAAIARLREIGSLSITIIGANGEQLVVISETVLNDDHIPGRIKQSPLIAKVPSQISISLH